MLGHAEAVSRATPGSGSPMLNLTGGEYCLPSKKAPPLRHVPGATSHGSPSYSFFFLAFAPLFRL